MTDSGVTVHFPHDGDMQVSVFSDVFAQIGSRFNPSPCPGHSQTGIHDPSARVAAISTFNEGIDAARQFVCSLITRRNALVPISVLPPEIVSRVFHSLVLEEPPLSGRLTWIRVTHVCRHWRQVALDNSSLWAKIWGDPTNAKKWIPEMLDRAKNAPLDFKLSCVTKRSGEALLMIPPHLSHTRRLHFHSLSTLHSDSIREIYSREAPNLEHFRLSVTAFSPFIFPELGGNMLFKGHTPRLRTFSLFQVLIPWSLIPRGQLTQLEIAYRNDLEDVDHPGELNQLIDLLANCPALEILTLKSCLPSQLTEFPHDRTIPLSNLSCLRLRGLTFRITNMLKMLKLPSSTTLRLDCIPKTTSIHEDPEGALLAVISAQFQSPAPIEFKSLIVTLEGHLTNLLNITALTFPNRPTQNFKGIIVDNAELVLSFDGLYRPRHLTNILEQACKMLPISNLEFISMSVTHKIDINWVELFGRCTNVTTMKVIGDGASSLVQALTAPAVTNARFNKGRRKRKRDNRESTLAQPVSTVVHAYAEIFPKLKFLGLTKLNFSKGKRTSGILFNVFERGLQQHMVAGEGPLKSLCISNCNISTEQVNNLQKLAQEIHWDENERFNQWI